MFLDFSIISVLLVASHLMRSQLRLLQNLFIPAPIIAGTLGLIGSDQFLDVLPFSQNEDGRTVMASYPSLLVTILFATLFMGHRPRAAALSSVRRVGDTFFYNLAAEIGQYACALLFGVAVMSVAFPDLNSGFAMMLPAGFVGGHGTATVVGEALQKQGWEDALSIGYTFATVGLLAGIFGGLLLINVAVRRGWTRLIQSPHELPDGIAGGFIESRDQTSMGNDTVSPMAIDPLAWHVALVLSAFGAAHMIDASWKELIPGSYSLPLFAVSMLVGAALQKCLDAFGLGEFVDRRVITRIGSTVSDYLIAFGVASIRIQVVIEHALPLVVMSLFGVTYAVAFLWFVGRRIFHNYWFERSIFVYGWSTGVVAIGILLLRIVDPRFRSRTLEDYGLAYAGIAPLEIALLIALPPLIVRQVIVVPAVVLLGLTVACLAVSARFVGWSRQSPDELRPGEDSLEEVD